jgi:hypothetical protein
VWAEPANMRLGRSFVDSHVPSAIALAEILRVTSPSSSRAGQLVPGARVSVRAVAIGSEHITVTNPVGAYTLSALPVGQYTSHSRWRSGRLAR